MHRADEPRTAGEQALATSEVEVIIESRRVRQILRGLTPEYRELTVDFLRATLPKLRGVRRLRDIKALRDDPEILGALERTLVPLLQKAVAKSSKGALPLRRRTISHLAVSSTGIAGPVAANLAELQVLFTSVAGTPATGAASATISVPAAMTVGFVAELIELYVQLSVATAKLRHAGIEDEAVTTAVMLRAFAPSATGAGAQALTKAAERLAVRLLERSAADWVPGISVATGLVWSNLDLHRLHRACDDAIRERQPAASQPT